MHLILKIKDIDMEFVAIGIICGIVIARLYYRFYIKK